MNMAGYIFKTISSATPFLRVIINLLSLAKGKFWSLHGEDLTGDKWSHCSCAPNEFSFNSFTISLSLMSTTTESSLLLHEVCCCLACSVSFCMDSGWIWYHAIGWRRYGFQWENPPHYYLPKMFNESLITGPFISGLVTEIFGLPSKWYSCDPDLQHLQKQPTTMQQSPEPAL